MSLAATEIKLFNNLQTVEIKLFSFKNICIIYVVGDLIIYLKNTVSNLS